LQFCLLILKNIIYYKYDLIRVFKFTIGNMVKLLLISLVIFFINILDVFSAKLDFKIDFPIENKKIDFIYGGFIEFLNDFINGENGIWSQEITNRGFDLKADSYGVSKYWFKTFTDLGANKIELLNGGYNPNGLYFQRLSKIDSLKLLGISQKVYFEYDSGDEFYIYLKSNISNPDVFLIVNDTLNKKEFFKKRIDGISNNWQKFSVKIPANSDLHYGNLSIVISSKCVIDIDEASLMPRNNVLGLKNSRFKELKEMKTKIFRYPGGYFAETENNKLAYQIGDIDKRKSPNLLGPSLQRMDMGINEYMLICRELGAEPHMVIGLQIMTTQEALDILEYCNGDTNTVMGKLRKSHGFPEPWKIKYWELGNEDWENTKVMCYRYLERYKAFKSKDPNVLCLINGNIWGGLDYFNEVFSIIENNCDFYSVHNIFPGKALEKIQFDSDRYYCVMASSKTDLRNYENYKKILNEKNLSTNIKFAVTESLIDYGMPGWKDTTSASFSLEAGLWMAGNILTNLNISELTPIYEKTLGMNDFRFFINKDGKRIFYNSPIIDVIAAINNSLGDYKLSFQTEIPLFNTKAVMGLYQIDDVPAIESFMSYSNDKISIILLNKLINEDIEINFEFPFEVNGKKAQVKELTSENYFDYNSYESPDKVRFKNYNMNFNSSFILKRNSFTAIEIDYPDFLYILNEIRHNIIINPNPAGDYIEVNNLLNDDITKDREIEIKIFNYSGQEIDKQITKTINKGIKARINTSAFPKGLYFVKIGNKYGKFIKN
jgi:alpha-N-arabinofuranosidase